MSVLIVDDETSTRDVLRELLSKLGYKTVLEAKDGLEGLKVLEQEKTRVEMIIADWEMPRMNGLAFLKKVSEHPLYDLFPFLLITSDFPKTRLEDFQKDNPRLDSFLNKPFRLSAFARALGEATRHRASMRSSILYIGQAPEGLKKALFSPETTHFREVASVNSSAELEEAMRAHSRKLGAVFVNPTVYARIQKEDWLGKFSKTPLGTETILLCLSRDPKSTFPVRVECQMFMEPPQTTKDWDMLLERLTKKLVTVWEVDRIFADLKAKIQEKEFTEAKKLGMAGLKIDSYNADLHNALADVLSSAGKNAQAISHLKKSLEINPCSPRAYLKLLQLLPADKTDERAELAKSARDFCPQNPDILSKTEQVLRDTKHA